MFRPMAILVLMAVVFLAPEPGEAADAAAGQAVFNRCKICHALEAGKHIPVGPNLHGMFGRKAGTVDNFAYSEAMKQFGYRLGRRDAGKIPAQIRKQFIPGNRMAFPGIKDDKQIADLLAYLHQATQ